MASVINERSMTAEIIARLEASFPPDFDGDPDAELLAIFADIDSLKRKLVQSHKRRK